MRVTVTRVLSRKVCYLSNMDSSLSSPGKLKEDLDRESLQTGKLPVSTKSNLVIVTGAANRLLLTKEILDFCGALPIYNTEISPWNDTSNGTSRPMTGHRIARTIVRKYTPCKNTDTLEYFAKCMDAKWDLSCKMQSHNCYYMVTCKNQKPKKSSWKCTQLHLRNSFPVCCNLICPLKKGRKGR